MIQTNAAYRFQNGIQQIQPGNQQNQPINQQFQPGIQPFQPGSQSFLPENQRFQPLNQQFQPGNQPFKPVNQQFQPGIQQNQPGIQQFQPVNQQIQPENQQFQPGNQQIQPGNKQSLPGNQQFHPVNQQIRPGYQQPQPGIQPLQSASQQFQNGYPQIQPGNRQFQSGIQQFQPGNQQIRPGSQQFQPGNQLSPGNQQFQPGYQQSQPGIQPFQPASQQFQNGYQQIQPINLLQDVRNSVFEPYEPPKINLPPIFEYSDVNCSPDVFRCTLTTVPQTQEILKKCRLPFGLILHPFKDMKQLSVLQSSLIVRCRSCRTYINPFVTFPDQRHWKCNMCGRINDLPDEFHFDPATKSYGDAKRRPEIKNATVEFIAPAEYMPIRKNVENFNEVRSPQPPVYLFVLDVSCYAVETGYLECFCNKLIDNLDHIPGDQRTMIGFIAVDSNLHFYYLQNNRIPKEFVIGDLEEVFTPWNEGLLVNLSQNKEAITQFLQSLPDVYSQTRDAHCALGAALNTAHNLISDTGGRITVMQTILPDIGPGSLISREDPNLRSARDINNLGPATDFYKRLALECCAHQVAIDLFMMNSQYADVATLSEMAKFSGGSLHYYPSLNAVRNIYELKRYEEDLNRYLTRKIGFEAVLRVRCSKGLALHSFHGNFFVRSTDLLALPNVNPDSACGIQVSMDDNLTDVSTVCFQSALLYTSSRGERRIRVHTLCLPVRNQLNEIHAGADAEAIISMLAKMAVDRSVSGNLSDAREAMVNACVDALGSFSSLHSASQRSGALLSAPNLKRLPLYVLGLLKHAAFTYGTSIKLDRRVYWMCSMKTMSIYYMMLQIYPNLYPLHTLDQKGQDPPLLQLSYEKIDRHGVYLLDAGDFMYVYVGQAVSEQFCRNVFDVQHFTSINADIDELPEISNAQSEAIRSFMQRLKNKRPFSSPLRIIREDSPNRELFVQKLVDDRCESTFSYIEFLQHIQKELNK